VRSSILVAAVLLAGCPKKGPTQPPPATVTCDNVGQSMTYNLLTPANGAGTPVDGAYADPRLAPLTASVPHPGHSMKIVAAQHLAEVSGCVRST